MQRIDLPLCPWLRALALLGPLLSMVVIGLASLTVLSKLGLLITFVATAWFSWRHYLRRRPLALEFDGIGNKLVVHTLSGPSVVVGVAPGMISPHLVSVRLLGEDGSRADLFVCSSVLTHDQHWQLRRLLLAWREPRSQSVL